MSNPVCCLFFDLETTGLDPKTCQIVQLSILNAKGRILFVKTFDVQSAELFDARTNTASKLQTDQQIIEALAYNDLPLESLKPFRPLALQDLDDVLRIFENCNLNGGTVVAYNVSYDSEVLKQTSLRLIGIDLFQNIKYDCAMLAWMTYKKSAKRLRLPNLGLESKAHDSSSDADNCRKAYQMSLGTQLESIWNF